MVVIGNKFEEMKGAIREGHPLSKLWEKFLNRLYEVVTDRETNLEAFLMKDIDEISVDSVTEFLKSNGFTKVVSEDIAEVVAVPTCSKTEKSETDEGVFSGFDPENFEDVENEFAELGLKNDENVEEEFCNGFAGGISENHFVQMEFEVETQQDSPNCLFEDSGPEEEDSDIEDYDQSREATPPVIELESSDEVEVIVNNPVNSSTTNLCEQDNLLIADSNVEDHSYAGFMKPSTPTPREIMIVDGEPIVLPANISLKDVKEVRIFLERVQPETKDYILIPVFPKKIRKPRRKNVISSESSDYFPSGDDSDGSLFVPIKNSKVFGRKENKNNNKVKVATLPGKISKTMPTKDSDESISNFNVKEKSVATKTTEDKDHVVARGVAVGHSKLKTQMIIYTSTEAEDSDSEVKPGKGTTKTLDPKPSTSSGTCQRKRATNDAVGESKFKTPEYIYSSTESDETDSEVKPKKITPKALEQNATTSRGKYQRTTATNRFMCQICDKLFTRKGDLNRHITSVHRKPQKFKCTHKGCTKSYTRKDDLLRHQNAHKKNPKKFECDRCERFFFSSNHLNMHKKKHGN